MTAFADLTEAEQARIAELCHEVEVQPGAALTAEGEFGYSFFVVQDGSAEVTEERERTAELGPGDFFGEIGLLVTGRRTATVTAKTPMRLLAFFDQDFRCACREVPAFEQRVREAMAERFARR
jgi:CRP/FNR family transcriptional regulator, cyclic AMP receptor protein